MKMKELVFKNWKTTLFGVLSLILFALVNFGVITPDQSEGLQTGVNTIIGNLDSGSIIQAISNILLVVGNALLLFVKDPKKETK
jgi:hypothetical protein